MKREIHLLCAAVMVVALLYWWQGRYEFLNDGGTVVARGDRWTGCIAWARPGLVRQECP